ncbi:TPA: hypothetical protein QCX51_005597 [Bacillus mycoides]|nr:hypothetical protein [Bacillus mycoides]NUC20392.1 hypothetical protein [Bacillus mycoides]HDR7568226.1 hypothetical protein [Bacillus mycoides]
MIETIKDVVTIIVGVVGIINVGLDIHTKTTKKLQQNKKRKRNNRKRK